MVFTHDQETVKAWVLEIENQIKKFGSYFLVDFHDIMGNLMVIFAKNSLKTRISNIEHESV